MIVGLSKVLAWDLLDIFLPYQEKIFDYPVDKLCSSWAGVVPPTSLGSILEGALSERDIHAIGYNAQFIYTKKGGIDNLITGFYESLTKRVVCNSTVLDINIQHKTVTLDNGHCEPYEYLISTIPLNNCLAQIKTQSTRPYQSVSKKLLCNKLINLNLGVKKSSLEEKHWIYYPEKQYPFFRIGLPSYLNPSMAPEGCSSLSVEIATLQSLDSRQTESIIKKARDHVQSIFNFSSTDIVHEHTLLLPHAYVIFDKWRESNLDTLLAQLKSSSVFSVGRYGSWKYSSMHDAILDGKSVAQEILSRIQDNVYLNCPGVMPKHKELEL